MRSLSSILVLSLLSACGTAADDTDTDTVTDDTDGGSDTDTTGVDTDDTTGGTDTDDGTGTETDDTDERVETDDTEDTEETDDTDVVITPRDPPATGWWLNGGTQTVVTDTCGLTSVPFPSFELAYDGTDWTASSPELNGDGLVVDFPAMSFSCVYVDSVSLTCTASTTLDAYPATVVLRTTDWWVPQPTWTATATVTIPGGSCSVTRSAAFKHRAPLAACGTPTYPTEPTNLDGVMRAVVYKQDDSRNYTRTAASVGDFDVEFPGGSTALGTPPSSGGTINTWAAFVELGERFTVRVVPDSADLVTWYPTNVTGLTDSAYNYYFVDAFRRSYWVRAILAGGAVPQDPARGLVAVKAIDSNGNPVVDAIVSASGVGGDFVTPTFGTSSLPRVTVHATPNLATGQMVFTNVCPGTIPVSMTNRDGVPCVVEPQGDSLAGAAIDVAVRGGEFSQVVFQCPAASPPDTGF